MTKIFDMIMGDPYIEFSAYVCIGHLISSALCWWMGLDEIESAWPIVLWISLITVVFPRLGERK